MKRPYSLYLRRAAITAAALVLILAIIVSLLYRYAEQRDFYFEQINALVGDKAGYVLRKTDPLELTLWPRPTLIAENLTITNPAVDASTPIAAVRRVSAALQWSPLLKLDLVLDVATDGTRMNLAIDADGRENWMNEELRNISGGLPFRLDKIDARQTALSLNNLGTGEVLAAELEQFDLDLAEGRSSARIETAGRLGDSRFYMLGDASFESNDKRLEVDLEVGAGRAPPTAASAIRGRSVAEWIEAHAESFPLRGSVAGRVAFEDRIPDGRLDFNARISSLREFAYLAEPLGLVSDSLGTVAARGAIQLQGTDLDVTGLEVSARDAATEIDLTGTLTNLLSDAGAELALKCRADALTAVIDPALVPVSARGAELLTAARSVDLEATVVARPDLLRIDELKAGWSVNGLHAEARGRVETTSQADNLRLDLDLRGEAADPAEFLRTLGYNDPRLQNLGPFNVSARVTGDQRRYVVEHGEAALQGGNVRAELAGELTVGGDGPRFDVKSQLSIDDAGAFSRLLPALPDRALAGFNLSTEAKIQGSLQHFGIQGLDLNLSRKGQQLRARGAIADLPGKPKANVDFHVAWDRSIPLDDYFPELGPLELTGPVEIDGAVHNSTHRIRIGGITLRAERTDVDGDVIIDTRMSPPRIYVVAESKEFFMPVVRRDADAGPAPPPKAEAESATPEGGQETPPPGTDPGELYKARTRAIKIRTEWIKHLDLYLSFSARRAKLRAYELEDLMLTIDIRDGVFTLAEYQAKIEQKPVIFAGFVDAKSSPPAYAFRGKLEGDTLEGLLNLEPGLVSGGALNANFRLLTRGDDLGELIEHLNGEALVTMGPLDIRSTALNAVSSDIFQSMLRGITRTKEDRARSSYRCGVLGVDISNGVAVVNKSFAMEADDYNLAGQGRVDLNTGYVDLTVAPKARRGLGLSPSLLVGGFKIQGHMATPNFGLRGGGLLTAAITGYALTPTAALAANPATATILATGFFAKGIFDRLTAHNYTCANTLKRIERNRKRLSSGRTRNPHIPKWRR